MSAITYTGITAGSVGSGTSVPVLTFDAYGRCTGLSSTTVTVNGVAIAPSTITPSGQILSPSAATPTTPNFSFSGDGDTGIYHVYANGVGIACNGANVATFGTGTFYMGATADDASGSVMQITQASGGNGVILNGHAYGSAAAIWLTASGGTTGTPTATTTAQIGRFGLRCQDNLTAGTTSSNLGANLEITPALTWTSTDHGTDISLWYTPKTTTTRTKALDIPSLTGDVSASVGHVRIETAGKGIGIKSGSNCMIGNSGAMTAGSRTVNNTAVRTGDIIMLTYKTIGGTPTTPPIVSAIVDSTSFTITAGVGDTSTIDYVIFRPL